MVKQHGDGDHGKGRFKRFEAADEAGKERERGKIFAFNRRGKKGEKFAGQAGGGLLDQKLLVDKGRRQKAPKGGVTRENCLKGNNAARDEPGNLLYHQNGNGEEAGLRPVGRIKGKLREKYELKGPKKKRRWAWKGAGRNRRVRGQGNPISNGGPIKGNHASCPGKTPMRKMY